MAARKRMDGRYGLLFLATVASLFVQGMVSPSSLQQVVVTGLAGATLLLAFRAAGVSRLVLRIVATVAAAALAISILRAAGGGIGEGAARTMNAALVACGSPAIAVGLVRDLRATGVVDLRTLFGVLSLYMLVGMAFGFVYGAIDRFGGDPFFAGGQAASVAHCLYFSFTTLATVGYGDFVARSNVGHTLAVFEALIGQIYLVTIVSLIVSNLRRPRRDDVGS
jgi:Ion channel